MPRCRSNDSPYRDWVQWSWTDPTTGITLPHPIVFVSINGAVPMKNGKPVYKALRKSIGGHKKQGKTGPRGNLLNAYADISRDEHGGGPVAVDFSSLDTAKESAAQWRAGATLGVGIGSGAEESEEYDDGDAEEDDEEEQSGEGEHLSASDRLEHALDEPGRHVSPLASDGDEAFDPAAGLPSLAKMRRVKGVPTLRTTKEKAARALESGGEEHEDDSAGRENADKYSLTGYALRSRTVDPAQQSGGRGKGRGGRAGKQGGGRGSGRGADKAPQADAQPCIFVPPPCRMTRLQFQQDAGGDEPPGGRKKPPKGNVAADEEANVEEEGMEPVDDGHDGSGAVFFGDADADVSGLNEGGWGAGAGSASGRGRATADQHAHLRPGNAEYDDFVSDYHHNQQQQQQQLYSRTTTSSAAAGSPHYTAGSTLVHGGGLSIAQPTPASASRRRGLQLDSPFGRPGSADLPPLRAPSGAPSRSGASTARPPSMRGNAPSRSGTARPPSGSGRASRLAIRSGDPGSVGGGAPSGVRFDPYASAPQPRASLQASSSSSFSSNCSGEASRWSDEQASRGWDDERFAGESGGRGRGEWQEDIRMGGMSLGDSDEEEQEFQEQLRQLRREERQTQLAARRQQVRAQRQAWRTDAAGSFGVGGTDDFGQSGSGGLAPWDAQQQAQRQGLQQGQAAMQGHPAMQGYPAMQQAQAPLFSSGPPLGMGPFSSIGAPAPAPQQAPSGYGYVARPNKYDGQPSQLLQPQVQQAPMQQVPHPVASTSQQAPPQPQMFAYTPNQQQQQQPPQSGGRYRDLYGGFRH